MYNRYVPGSNGIYERQTIQDAPAHRPREEKPVCAQETDTTVQQQPRRPQQNTFFGFDLGDLLLLCIVILLLLDSDEEDLFPILIMAAAFLLQQ